MLTLADISEKIESIRRQPEHTRIRYVWGCVAVSMFIVFILWIFSIASMFTEKENGLNQTNTEITPSIGEQLQEIQKQAPSLKNLNSQSLSADNENSVPISQNATTTANTSDGIESSMYSNLQNTNLSQ